MDELEEIRRKKMKEMLNMEIKLDVTDSTFQKDVLEQSKTVPVLVDFWSERCPPCMMLGPILEKLASEFSGRFVLAKANVGPARSMAIQYRVQGIPSVKLFKDGNVAAEFVGAMPEEEVRSWLEQNV